MINIMLLIPVIGVSPLNPASGKETERLSPKFNIDNETLFAI